MPHCGNTDLLPKFKFCPERGFPLLCSSNEPKKKEEAIRQTIEQLGVARNTKYADGLLNYRRKRSKGCKARLVSIFGNEHLKREIENAKTRLNSLRKRTFINWKKSIINVVRKRLVKIG